MSEQKKPKLFLYSIILFVVWSFLGTIIYLIFPEARLGVYGLLLNMYITITAISWHFVKAHKRHFYTIEKVNLSIYLTGWAVLCESWSTWAISMENPEIDIFIPLAIAAAVDCAFMILGVFLIGKRMCGFFLDRAEQAST